MDDTTFPDLGTLSDQELKDLIQQLSQEEEDVSYRRRMLHGKIDILRAELVNRLRVKHSDGQEIFSGSDVERLTQILAGHATPPPSSDAE
jgi:hypothetical protein